MTPGIESSSDGPIVPSFEPIDVLVVASWYPSAADPAAGRFVADQVEALQATGLVRPRVVTFDPARLSGGARARARQADATLDATRRAIEASSIDALFVRGAVGVGSDVPVARLAIPDGVTRTTGPDHAAAHRSAVLATLGDRLRPVLPARGVVHAHTVYPDGAAAVVLAERLGWPLLVTEHSSFVDEIVAEPVVRRRYAATLLRAVAVLAVGSRLADELRSRFPESAHRITVLPNAVPIDLAAPIGPDGRDPDELLFVGRLKPTKGIDTLLQAVALARRERPALRLRLIGGAPDTTTAAHWRKRSAELGLDQVIAFEDRDDRAAIRAAMARAALFVHPSPRETFGVVAVEALAAGLPVVATDSGGVTEILGENPQRLGALVPVDDPEALGRAILATLNRRSEFDPESLRAAVERRYGAAYVAERLIVRYREMLSSPASGIVRDSAIDSASPLAIDTNLRYVVIALDRAAAARAFESVPRDIRSRLTLVTTGGAAAANGGEPARLPEISSVIEVALGSIPLARTTGTATHLPAAAAGSTIRRRLRDPIASARRWLDLEGRGRDLGAIAQTIALVIAEQAAGSARVELVAADGIDHLAAAAALAGGSAQPSVGGLRRLADLGNEPADADATVQAAAPVIGRRS